MRHADRHYASLLQELGPADHGRHRHAAEEKYPDRCGGDGDKCGKRMQEVVGDLSRPSTNCWQCIEPSTWAPLGRSTSFHGRTRCADVRKREEKTTTTAG
ncbi:unnamed protein product [Symbiodinium sp. CCMP2592]|nr:unnamed protein product [Symbiodinium sp. CCMP2592]